MIVLLLRLCTEITRILRTAAMKERLAMLGAAPQPGTPETFGAFVEAGIAKYRPIVADSDVD
jgi:tripartite-type tricarboxylate transporter receptor subunit TctC